MMGNAIKIRKIALLFVIAIALSFCACASSRSNFIRYKKAESTCDLSRLGKNKYFYSNRYQRKLERSIREIAKH